MIPVRNVSVHAIAVREDEAVRAARSVLADAAILVHPFEEKTISSPRRALGILRSHPADVILFCTRDLSLQRFQVMLKLLLLLAPAREAALIDVQGRHVRVQWVPFLLLDLPRFLVEVLASAFVIVATAVGLLRLRSMVGGGGR